MSVGEQARIDEQMQKGIAAAKAGDKATARTYFERVIALDKNHEKAWFWLASVVESVEERRVCLGNVLFLNPNNERARRLLEQLEARASEGKANQAAPGEVGALLKQLDRRVVIGGGIGAAVVIVLLIVLLGGRGGQPVAMETTTPSTPTPSATPTATFTVVPTWTPEPSPTPRVTNTPQVFPSPPPGITGRLVMGTGPRFYVERFLPIRYVGIDGSNPFTVGDEDTRTRGRHPVFSPDGTTILYEVGGTDGSSRLSVVDLFGENRVFITDGAVRNVEKTDAQGKVTVTQEPIRFGSENHPAWSPTRSLVAFAGLPPGGVIHQIYVIALGGSAPLAIPITDNEFDNTWPSWSPDGRRLVYVTDRRAQGGVDLHIAAADGSSDANLTFDGNDLIERAPDWSPNTRSIVFEGTGPENYERDEYDAYDSDIYIIDDVNGGTPPRVLFPPPTENDGDEEEGTQPETARDMLPRFSPDGRYIVFTSNRSGNWEVYIFELATSQLFQVTFSDREIDIAGDWSAR